MNNESEVQALFVLCRDLKQQVQTLTEKVEALSAAQTTSQNCNCSSEISEIQEEILTNITGKQQHGYKKTDSWLFCKFRRIGVPTLFCFL